MALASAKCELDSPHRGQGKRGQGGTLRAVVLTLGAAFPWSQWPQGRSVASSLRGRGLLAAATTMARGLQPVSSGSTSHLRGQRLSTMMVYTNFPIHDVRRQGVHSANRLECFGQEGIARAALHRATGLPRSRTHRASPFLRPSALRSNQLPPISNEASYLQSRLRFLARRSLAGVES